MITAAILTTEVAFWIVLLAALACRYALRLRRASAALLIALPLVDVALLALVIADLHGGADPSASHAFAGVYLGFTVAFGHPLIRWADGRFAHRFRGTPLPTKPTRGSLEEVRRLWSEWLRVVAASAVAVAIMAGLSIMTGSAALPPSIDAAASNPFWAQMTILGIVTVVWFLAGPAFARTRPAQGAR